MVTSVETLYQNTSERQLQTRVQSNETRSLLLQLLSNQEQLRSNQDLIQHVERAVVPVVRAQMTRQILPAVEHGLDLRNSHFDMQINRVHQAIDKVANSVGHGLAEIKSSNSHLLEQIDPLAGPQNNLPKVLPTIAHLDERNFSLSSDHQSGGSGAEDQISRQTRFWIRRWSIGFLCIKIITRRNRSKDLAFCESFGKHRPAWSEIHDVCVMFQPIRFITSTGVCVKTGSRADSDGYYPMMCPGISTFAIIPSLEEEPEVWSLVWANDVETLKGRFTARLNSPTDRDENGRTLLHVILVDHKSIKSFAEPS